MIRRGHSQSDYFNVSFEYTKDQFVLGVSLGSPNTRYVPTESQIAHVRELVNSGILLYRTLIEVNRHLVGLVVGHLLSICLYSLFLCLIF